MHSLAFAVTLLASSLFSSASAKPARRNIPGGFGKSELVVYWGNGDNQKPLADFCDDDTFDIIPIGFVNKFPGQEGTFGLPGTNFANACYGDEYFIDANGDKTAIFSPCANIERDMAVCQQNGKKMLVSIGGDSPGNQLASKEAAVSFAQQLWEIFGPKPDGFTGPRPFGDNIVDGFDLDIESGDGSFVPDLAAALSALTSGDSSRKYYLTAAPQCPLPDSRLSAALQAAPFDHVSIQFYNSPSCAASGSGFNWDDWAAWLSGNSLNKDISLFLGLPASPQAAPSHTDHYLNLDDAKSLIESLMCSNPHKSQFGGVMLWEATYSENNQENGKSYAENIKDLIKGCSCFPHPTTTTTTAAPTTTSSTTSSTTTTPAAPTTTTSSIATTTSTTSSYVHLTTTTSAAPTTTTSSTTTLTSTTTSYTHPTAMSSATLPLYTSTSTTISYTHPTTLRSETLPPYTSTSSTPALTTTPLSTATLPTYTPAESSTTSSYGTWGDWTSSSSSVPAASSKTTTSASYDPSHTWEDWTTSTTSSVPAGSTKTTTSVSYDPSHTWADWPTTSTSSTPATATSTASEDSTHSWEDWTSTTTTSKPVDPTSSTSSHWADWAVSTSSTPVADATTTSSTYSWADWTSTPVADTSSTPAVTSATTWADWSASTLSVSVITQGDGSSLVTPSAGTGKPVAPATSSYPVSPATFTGAAPADELPATVFSVAVCVAVAVVGLFI